MRFGTRWLVIVLAVAMGTLSSLPAWGDSSPSSSPSPGAADLTYTVGTLVVDLFDTNTKKLIWRGSASDTLSSKSDKNIKKLNMDVKKMFDRFPPETGKEQL